jgi:radical SAM enzyme (TIGR01210 family)
VESIAETIEKGSRKAGKTYHFNERHDHASPWKMWFQESDEGLILFIVFYSQACRWSQCLGCNLPSKMSQEHVSYKDLVHQIDHIFCNPKVVHKQDKIHKVIVSNNGSILDEDTFSSTALMYLLVQVNMNMPNLKVLSIETRAEYVDLAELEFLSRALAESDGKATLEIAIGFEAFDEHIRNDVFFKGLTLKRLEQMVEDMAPFGFRLKCYFMQKPVPGMTETEAVEDIHSAIDYLGMLSDKYGVAINMHLNPTYVATGTKLEEAFLEGKFSPPFLKNVAKAALQARNTPVSIFIGLNDEGLAAEGGSFIRRGEEELVEQLEEFNRTQDFEILERACE